MQVIPVDSESFVPLFLQHQQVVEQSPRALPLRTRARRRTQVGIAAPGPQRRQGAGGHRVAPPAAISRRCGRCGR
jgi:hypothetical protein